LKSEFGLTVRWTAFPLHPETPAEGRTLEDLFKGTPVDIGQVMAHLKKTAAGLGLPFGERKRTYNSRLAQELGKWAESEGRGDAFHEAAFRAYFVDGRNLAQTAVLLELAAAAGLDPQEARRVVEARSFKAAVDLDWERSRSLGIRAVPTFRMGLESLVGAQPYDALALMVRKNQVAAQRL
jgi:predicted DsbA family dithiol-disulfide isomerase